MGCREPDLTQTDRQWLYQPDNLHTPDLGAVFARVVDRRLQRRVGCGPVPAVMYARAHRGGIREDYACR